MTALTKTVDLVAAKVIGYAEQDGMGILASVSFVAGRHLQVVLLKGDVAVRAAVVFFN